MTNYTKDNLIPIPVSTVQKGSLAIKVGNEVFVAGGTNTDDATATSNQILEGATAYVKGERIVGNIKTVSLKQQGYVVSIDKGYTEGGSVTVETPSYPDASVSVNKNIVNITSGLVSEQEVVIPSGSVVKEGINIKISEGYVESGKITLSTVEPTLNGNVFKITEGYVEDTYELTVPEANINETDDEIVVGQGYVPEEKRFEKGSGSGSVSFGVVDENGNFQPLNAESTPPVASGSAIQGTFYTFETDRDTQLTPSGGGSFVKVTNFVAPHDAYTSVTAINVSGFGMLNNEMEGTDEDFSKYNGVYSITPTTANETELTSRIFKHPTEEMHLFFAQEQDYGEGDCWCFNRSVDTYFSAYEALAFKTGRELPNGQTTWSKVYYDQPTLTTTHITSDIPAQELVLEGFSATLENGVWNIGSAVTLSGYDKTPLKYGIYAVAENKLIGDAIAYHADMYMPTDGLLAYFPMDDSGNIAVDVVNGLKLTKMGKSLVNGVTGVQGTCWENFSEQNNALSGVNTVFDLPEEFTISACVFYNGQESWRDCLPIIDFGSQQKDTGFGIRVGGRETARYSLRIAGEETGDHISNVPNQSWHTITFSWQKKSNGDFTAKGYLDGQKVYESDWDSYYAISNSTQISMFGRGGTFETTSASVPCKIDEVMLWNRVLSADEVAQLVIR